MHRFLLVATGLIAQAICFAAPALAQSSSTAPHAGSICTQTTVLAPSQSVAKMPSGRYVLGNSCFETVQCVSGYALTQISAGGVYACRPTATTPPPTAACQKTKIMVPGRTVLKQPAGTYLAEDGQCFHNVICHAGSTLTPLGNGLYTCQNPAPVPCIADAVFPAGTAFVKTGPNRFTAQNGQCYSPPECETGSTLTQSNGTTGYVCQPNVQPPAPCIADAVFPIGTLLQRRADGDFIDQSGTCYNQPQCTNNGTLTATGTNNVYRCEPAVQPPAPCIADAVFPIGTLLQRRADGDFVDQTGTCYNQPQCANNGTLTATGTNNVYRCEPGVQPPAPCIADAVFPVGTTLQRRQDGNFVDRNGTCYQQPECANDGTLTAAGGNFYICRTPNPPQTPCIADAVLPTGTAFLRRADGFFVTLNGTCYLDPICANNGTLTPNGNNTFICREPTPPVAQCAATVLLPAGEPVQRQNDGTFLRTNGQCFDNVTCGAGQVLTAQGNNIFQCQLPTPPAPVCDPVINLNDGVPVQRQNDGTFQTQNGDCFDRAVCRGTSTLTAQGNNVFVCEAPNNPNPPQQNCHPLLNASLGLQVTRQSDGTFVHRNGSCFVRVNCRSNGTLTAEGNNVYSCQVPNGPVTPPPSNPGGCYGQLQLGAGQMASYSRTSGFRLQGVTGDRCYKTAICSNGWRPRSQGNGLFACK